MSKTHRSGSVLLKPRQLKRMRQWEALQRPRREMFPYPEPEPPRWKPLG
jgi:hypothetical protein